MEFPDLEYILWKYAQVTKKSWKFYLEWTCFTHVIEAYAKNGNILLFQNNSLKPDICMFFCGAGAEYGVIFV